MSESEVRPLPDSSASGTQQPPVLSTGKSRLLLPATAVVAALLIIWFFQSPSVPHARSNLIAATEKWDGKLAHRVKFWIDFTEAGHGTWAELDSKIDYDGGPFRPAMTVSDSTIRAYRQLREARRAAKLQTGTESPQEAKARLVAAINLWDRSSATTLNTWIRQIEDGEDAKLVSEALPTLLCSFETVAAFRAWIKVRAREAK